MLESVMTAHDQVKSASETTHPNFFIVGAPRCGTTALYQYLRQHDRIFMPTVKECHFMADDFADFRRAHDLDEYLGLFEGATPRHVAVGEASVFYLMSDIAIPNIEAFNPNARHVVMLRNPVELVQSLHEQLLGTLHEDEPDFETAWRLQETRRAGRRI